MLSLLVVSLAVAASAQYGPANDGGAVRPGYPVFYPPRIFHDWSSESREHRHRRQCPKLRTYLGEFPSIPTEAFYPPVIRYIKVDGRETALVVCDRDSKNTNVLFARRNETRDLRAADVASFGTTAGLVLTCDRRERRYVGTVLSFQAPDYTKKRQIVEFTCLGLDKTILGLVAEQTNKNIATVILDTISAPVDTRRRKREAEVTETPAATEAAEVVTEAQAVETEAPAVVTEAPAVVTEAPAVVTEAPAVVTEAPAVVTEAPAAETEAPAAVTESPAEATSATSDPADIDLTGDSVPEHSQVKDPKTAVKVAISNIGKILGSVF